MNFRYPFPPRVTLALRKTVNEEEEAGEKLALHFPGGTPMKHQSSWMVKVAALAVVVMVGAAVAVAVDPVGTSKTAPQAGESALFAQNGNAGPECQDEALPALELLSDQSAPEPVVVCLLIPECSRNSDCDARCGAGLGRCVHNPCPARICRCR